MADDRIALMAHLMRRAGFGATRDELETKVARGYDATVEDLLYPGEPNTMPEDIIRRVFLSNDEGAGGGAIDWTYRMLTTSNPLEEKITLFWHGLFAVGYAKGNQARSQLNQIQKFRENSLGSFRDLLIELSRDPAMIFWLDNNDNKKGSVNENYGRELLELFAMGIGSYTEQDVKECARAFTGLDDRQPRVHGGQGQQGLLLPLRAHRVALRVPARGPRRRREDLPRRDGQLQRRGCRRHHRPTGGDRPVHKHAAVPVLRRRRDRREGRGASRRHDPVVLRLGLRDTRRAAYDVQLRLLQVGRRAVRPRQEPGRARGRRHPHGRQLPGPEGERRRAVRRRELHGPGPPAASLRRGMARGLGVALQRIGRRAGQPGRQGVERCVAAGHPCHYRQTALQQRRHAVARGDGRRLPGSRGGRSRPLRRPGPRWSNTSPAVATCASETTGTRSRRSASASCSA